MTAAVRWNNSIAEFIEIRSGVLQVYRVESGKTYSEIFKSLSRIFVEFALLLASNASSGEDGSEDPNDLEALTPAHLLSGPITSNLPETGIQQENTLGSVTELRRSRRLQGREPIFQPLPQRIEMEDDHRPTVSGSYLPCQRQRDPSTFSGDENINPRQWLKEYERVSKYNR
ncbi:hypothetical protein LAZ67_2005509 [Cordylochernes scorpioides]|uniref:Uncharacterized protein n=1 Tax=Cordylochernes scorpioides TaxID=51811 RepID=A0ABY6K7S9_9ARAC|nr:hypothetical protein LAZ67_2005509 [Cordylochernes scorpioides]